MAKKKPKQSTPVLPYPPAEDPDSPDLWPHASPHLASPQFSIAPISTLTLDPNNAMDHPERNVATVTTSLHEYGAGRSIVIRNDVVVAGNCTTESAADAGFTEVIKVKPGPHQLVAVDRSDWTEEQAKQYALIDNRSSELSAWNSDVLLEQLDDLGLELAESIGWTEDEIRNLRLEVSGVKVEPEPAPKRPITTTTCTCPECGHTWSTTPE